MRPAWMTLILLAPLLAGCIGGEDPAPELGTYTVQTGEAGAGGDHSAHAGGPGALQHAAELDHFNATHNETFEVEQTPLGVSIGWEFATGQAQLVITDAADAPVLELSLTPPNGTEAVAVEGEPGTWTMTVAGDDATGSLSAQTGDPAAFGLVEDDPIAHEETYTSSSEAQEWTWRTPGDARLTLEATGVSGSAELLIMNRQGGDVIESVTVPAPGTAEQDIPVEGPAGAWYVALRTEGYSGTITFTLEQA